MRNTTEVANRKTAGTVRAEKRGNRSGLAARKGRNPSTAARLTLLSRLSSASLCLQRPKNGGHWVDKVTINFPCCAPAREALWPADRVERWPIDRLIPYAKNSRTHSEAQIAAGPPARVIACRRGSVSAAGVSGSHKSGEAWEPFLFGSVEG